MGHYMYEPLTESKSIRLLHLNPATSEQEPLYGDFAVTPLEHTSSFEAISYVWGDASFSRSFQINDSTKPIQITASLDAVLRGLRSKTEVRVIWVDGLCIDQSNDVERAAQVSLMAQIYQKATSVLAWIGDESAAKEKAFDLLQNSTKHASEKGSGTAADTEKTIDAESWVWMESVLSDVWLTRLWIVQEAILAKTLLLVCGAVSIPWDTFGSAIDRVLSKKPRSIRISKNALQGVRYIEHINNARRDFAMQHGARQNLQSLDMNNWMSSSTSMFPAGLLESLGNGQIIVNQNRGSHFSNLFWSLKSRNCKDDRDRVYAMLGFLPWDVNIKISPDYSYTAKRVYTDFARAMYERHFVELLVYAGLWDRAPADDESRDEECPSWVPELRPTKLVSGNCNAWDHPMLDYVIKNLEQPGIDWLSFYKLRIEGTVFDKIANVKEYRDIDSNEGLIYALRFYFNALAELHGQGVPFGDILQDLGKLLGVVPYPELGMDGRDDSEDVDRLSTLLLADAQRLLAVFEDGQRRYHENTLPAEQEAALGKMFDLTLFLRKRLTGRRLFITDKGRSGLAPSMALPGDNLARFMGQGVECLIRQVPDTEEWVLVGPCYYHAVAELNTVPRKIVLI